MTPTIIKLKAKYLRGPQSKVTHSTSKVEPMGSIPSGTRVLVLSGGKRRFVWS